MKSMDPREKESTGGVMQEINYFTMKQFIENNKGLIINTLRRYNKSMKDSIDIIENAYLQAVHKYGMARSPQREYTIETHFVQYLRSGLKKEANRDNRFVSIEDQFPSGSIAPTQDIRGGELNFGLDLNDCAEQGDDHDNKNDRHREPCYEIEGDGDGTRRLAKELVSQVMDKAGGKRAAAIVSLLVRGEINSAIKLCPKIRRQIRALNQILEERGRKWL